MQPEALRSSRVPVILFVSHGYAGGVARHIADLERAIGDRARIVHLRPAPQGRVVLRSGEQAMWFRAAEDWPVLLAVLRGIGIDRMHFHHVHGLPSAVLELPAQCACAHAVTLHDHFPACPAYHMKDGSLRYCGGSPDCGKCLEAEGSSWGMPIAEWRARFAEFLQRASRVIAPSQSAARAINAFFPAVKPLVWPHPQDMAPAAPAPARVIVPGAISVEKGLDVLEACLRDAGARELPLHFRVVGFLGRALPTWPELPLTVSGQYVEGALPRLLALERGDVAFFPAQCPETFSYTLSAALAAGLPVVASNLGALPERLAGIAGSRVLPWTSSAIEFNDALLAVAQPRAAAPSPGEAMMSAGLYVERYLEGVQRTSPAADLPPLDPRFGIEPRDVPVRSTTQWLFEDGVIAGKRASWDELRRRTVEVDGQLHELAARLAEARARADQAEQALKDARAGLEGEKLRGELDSRALEAARHEMDRLKSSRSWRITAPIRALARRLRAEPDGD